MEPYDHEIDDRWQIVMYSFGGERDACSEWMHREPTPHEAAQFTKKHKFDFFEIVHVHETIVRYNV